MWLNVVSALVFIGLAVLVSLVGATLFLATGSLLSRVFAVSVWEATVVIMAIVFVVFRWLWSSSPAEIEEADEEAPPEPPPIFMPPELSWRPSRRRRRRN